MGKKREKAVAIRYDTNKDGAPRVIAKGAGELAKKIITMGEDHHIPIYKDENLVEKISPMDIGDEIPVQLYEAMAQILAFVYGIKEEAKNKKVYKR